MGNATVSGVEWSPGSTVLVQWDSPLTTLGTPTPNAIGAFTLSFTVPVTAAEGLHTITATQGAQVKTTFFTVQIEPMLIPGQILNSSFSINPISETA